MVLRSKSWVVGALCGLCGLAGCKEDERPVIRFDAEQVLWDDAETDAGTTDLGGAGLSLRARGNADFRVTAVAEVIGGEVEPDPDGGTIRVTGELEVEPDVAVEVVIGGNELTGFTQSFTSEIGRFDPFMVGETIEMELEMPQQSPKRLRVANIPSVVLQLDPAPGSFAVTFGGACLHEEGDAIQYTGRITIVPDIRYEATLEIEIPLVPLQVLGPVEIQLDMPSIVDEPVDLGTFSVRSRGAIAGVEPCEGMDALPPPEMAETTG